MLNDAQFDYPDLDRSILRVRYIFVVLNICTKLKIAAVAGCDVLLGSCIAIACEKTTKKQYERRINVIPPKIAKYFKVKYNIHMQNTQDIITFKMMQQLHVNRNIRYTNDDQFKYVAIFNCEPLLIESQNGNADTHAFVSSVLVLDRIYIYLLFLY